MGTGPTNREDVLEKLEILVGQDILNWILKVHPLQQPNGDFRVDIWVKNEHSEPFKNRMKPLRRSLKWVTLQWLSWKERHGIGGTVRDSLREPTAPSRVIFATYNVNGLRGKLESVQHFLASETVSVLLVQETLIDADEAPVKIPGYNIFSKARRKEAGQRGQAIAVHHSVRAADIHIEDPNLLAIRLCNLCGSNWLVASVYLPSGGNYRRERGKCLKRLRRWIKREVHKDPSIRIILAGDWNIPRATLGESIAKWKLPLGIVPVQGSDKTRRTTGPLAQWGSLDYFVVTNKAARVLTASKVNRGWDLSDHYPVHCAISKRRAREPSVQETVKQLARTGLEGVADAIVTSNRWQVFLDMEVNSKEDVDNLATAFVDTCKEVATEVGAIKEVPVDSARVRRVKRHVELAINNKRSIFRELKRVELEAIRARADHPAKGFAAQLRVTYASAARKVKKLIRHERQLQYRLSLAKGAMLLRNHHTKEWWRWIDNHASFRTGHLEHIISPVYNDMGNLVVEHKEIAEAFKEHYEKLGRDPTGLSHDKAHWETKVDPITPHPPNVEHFTKEITWTEISNRLRFCRNGKSTGPDGIHYEFLKLSKRGQAKGTPDTPPNPFARSLLKFYNSCWEFGHVPDQDLVAYVHNVYKLDGPTTQPNNYRGIYLINHKNKLLGGLLNDRLVQHLDEHDVIHPPQAGFRPEEEVLANVCALYETVRRRHIEGKPTYLFYGDFRKAFDTVPHEAIVAKLKRIGVTEPVLSIILRTYKESLQKVKVGLATSSTFKLQLGTKQGDVPSPTVFDIFINDLIQVLLESDLGALVQAETLFLVLVALFFADDALSLAEDVSSLQTIISICEKWATTWCMTFGIKKCGVQLVRSDDCHEAAAADFEQLTFLLCNEAVPITHKYKYLGIFIRDNFGTLKAGQPDLKAIAQDRALKATTKLHLMRPYLREQRATLNQRLYAVQVQIVTTAGYGGELFGGYSGVHEIIQRPVNKAMKWILGYKAGNQVCNPVALSLELNIEFMHVRTLVARTRAWVKWHGSKTLIGELLNNLPKKHSRSTPKTWVTHLPWFIITYAGASLELINEAIVNEAACETLLDDVASYTRDAIVKREAKSSPLVAAYLKYDYLRTRDYIQVGDFAPRLSRGVTWLARFRCGAVWTRRIWEATQASKEKKKASHSGLCPACNAQLRGCSEYLHVLSTCSAYDVERKRQLGSVLDGLRNLADSLIHSRTVTGTLEEVTAVILLGGYSELLPDCDYSKGFGHSPEVPMGSGGYGFILVAQYLQAIMAEHMSKVFAHSVVAGSQLRGSGYISASQSDF